MQLMNLALHNPVAANSSMKNLKSEVIQKQVDLGDIYDTPVVDPEMPDNYSQMAMLHMQARGVPKDDLADGLRILNSEGGTGDSSEPVDTAADLADLGSTQDTYQDIVAQIRQARRAHNWALVRELRARARQILRDRLAARMSGTMGTSGPVDAGTVINGVGQVAGGASDIITTLTQFFGGE